MRQIIERKSTRIGLIVLGCIAICIAMVLILSCTRNTLSPKLPPRISDFFSNSTRLCSFIRNVADGSFQDGSNRSSAKPYCGGPDKMIVLLIGVETYEGYERGRAVLIKLVRIDMVNANAQVLSIPADLLVKIPGLEEYRLNEGMINAAYAWGNIYLGEGEGPVLLSKTLHTNFSIEVDYYLAGNREFFIHVIDAIGGIELDVPETEAGIQAGIRHFDGEQVQWYLRSRANDTDAKRLERQSQIFSAIIGKMVQPSQLIRIPRLFSIFRDSMLTDITPITVAKMTCIASVLQDLPISFFSLPTDSFAIGEDDNERTVLFPDLERMQSFLKDFINGDITESQ